MRGKDVSASALALSFGITPAYAGKSYMSMPEKPSGKDHPRVCGEKNDSCIRCHRWKGSPPRMRGKGGDGGVVAHRTGITPAYAGKSPAAHCRSWAAGDHPHVCGEKITAQNCAVTQMGSPPRMRGKAAGPAAHRLDRGITPAYAGKRASGWERGCGSGDHPRVCGEKASVCW